MIGDHRVADRLEAAVIRALAALAGASAPTRVMVLVAVCALDLGLDRITGYEASMVLVSTITVALAAWIFMDRRPAYATVVVLSLGSGFETLLARSDTTPTAVVWLDAGVRAASFAILATVVSALRRHLARTERIAHQDVLTGVASRHAILELLDRTSRRPRSSDLPLSVVYFDLDGLKRINDLGGHAAGDELIRRFATAIRDGVRSIDRLGRLGGDEFLLVCPGAGPDEVRSIMRRLTGDPGLPDVSWGVATTAGPTDPSSLIAAADRAMYDAKPDIPPPPAR